MVLYRVYNNKQDKLICKTSHLDIIEIVNLIKQYVPL